MIEVMGSPVVSPFITEITGGINCASIANSKVSLIAFLYFSDLSLSEGTKKGTQEAMHMPSPITKKIRLSAASNSGLTVGLYSNMRWRKADIVPIELSRKTTVIAQPKQPA